MKGMDLFCSSTASTAVTYSMHYRSRGTKSYDRDRRKSQLPHVPCSSQLPINPKLYLEKHRKSSAEKHINSECEIRRKSSVEVNDLYTHDHPSTVVSSRRYLLGDAPFIDWVSESDKIPAMAPSHSHHEAKPLVINRNNSHAVRSSSTRSKDQVFSFKIFFKK